MEKIQIKDVTHIVNKNPSKETIDRIQNYIKRKKELEDFFIKRYKENN